MEKWLPKPILLQISRTVICFHTEVDVAGVLPSWCTCLSASLDCYSSRKLLGDQELSPPEKPRKLYSPQKVVSSQWPINMMVEKPGFLASKWERFVLLSRLRQAFGGTHLFAWLPVWPIVASLNALQFLLESTPLNNSFAYESVCQEPLLVHLKLKHIQYSQPVGYW